MLSWEKKTEFTLISMSFSKIQIWISFPSFLSWYNTFHLLPHKSCVLCVCLSTWYFNWHWLKCCSVLRLAEGLWPGSFQTKHSGAYRVGQWSETPLLAMAGLTAGKWLLKWHSITQGGTKEEVSDACIYFNRFVPEAVNIMFMCVEGLWSIRTGFLLLPTASRSKAKHKFITSRAELEFCAGQLSWLISPDGASDQELDAH